MKYHYLIKAAVLCTTPVVAQNFQNNCPSYDGFSSFEDKCENKFFAEIDYLAWFLDQEGMSYATKVNVSSALGTTGLSTNSLGGKDLFFKTNWDSGVRAMLGFKPSSTSWDTRLVYTYFQTQDSPKRITSSAVSRAAFVDGILTTFVDGTVIVPSYFSVNIPNVNNSPANVTTISYTIDPLWKFTFNQLDLEFSQEFSITKDAAIRFFGGLRGLWTHQRFEETISVVSSTLNSDVLQLPMPTTSASFNAKNYFNSFGARSGFDLNYNVGWGLDIYANLAGAILWGWFSDRQSFAASTLFSAAQTFDHDESFNHSHHTTIFNFDTALGLRWNYWLNCNRNVLTLRLGWEQHVYTNINQFQQFSSAPALEAGIPAFNFAATSLFNDRNIERGDLSLSGIVVGLSYIY